MDLVWLGLIGLAMTAVVFILSVIVQGFSNRRFAASRRRLDRADEQMAQLSPRNALGGFDPGDRGGAGADLPHS